MSNSIPKERLAEIERWLQKPVTRDAALEKLASFDIEPPPKPTLHRVAAIAFTLVTGLWIVDLFWRLADGPPRTMCEHFLEWLPEDRDDFDEIREYDSGPESWDHLGGEFGYAILRDKKIVDFWMVLMN